MSSFTLNFRKFHLPIAILMLLCVGEAAQQKAEKSNMDLVGYDDLQARSAYQPTIHKQGERWIAYVGHHGGVQLNPLTGKQEDNGTSIIDVTDPKQPKYLAHIPGEPARLEEANRVERRWLECATAASCLARTRARCTCFAALVDRRTRFGMSLTRRSQAG